MRLFDAMDDHSKTDSFSGDSALLRSDDERNFRLLYDRYWKDLYQKAMSRLDNSSDAEEVVQDIFVSLWNNRYTVVVEESLRAYLFTAVKYAVIKKVQREQARGRIFPLNIEAIEQITLSNEEMLYYKQLEALIDSEVQLLPERMQEVYRLSRNEHLRNNEIAKQLNISEQTVKNILSESLKRLRARLSDYKFAIFLV
ncbi:RNA polymerase sigma factor [Niabella sp. 22666]|uniref:RNA polymerase sigma factor n=1 Tax=Niabella sp. 22666 TaxID=3453954 RepID=UPI003F875CC6